MSQSQSIRLKEPIQDDYALMHRLTDTDRNLLETLNYTLLRLTEILEKTIGKKETKTK